MNVMLNISQGLYVNRTSAEELMGIMVDLKLHEIQALFDDMTSHPEYFPKKKDTDDNVEVDQGNEEIDEYRKKKQKKKKKKKKMEAMSKVLHF
jgi:hypothetical protein